MDISKHKQFLLSEIKVNNPNPTRGVEGFKNFLKDWFKGMKLINQDLIQAYNDGYLNDILFNKIIKFNSYLSKKYNIEENKEWFREWLEPYKEDIGSGIKSSNSLYTALNDDVADGSERYSLQFGIDEEEAYDLYELEKQNH